MGEELGHHGAWRCRHGAWDVMARCYAYEGLELSKICITGQMESHMTMHK